VIGGKSTQGAALVLVVDADAGRRARASQVLASIPAKLVSVASHADAYACSADACIAVAVVDGRDTPMAALDMLRTIRDSQPFVVPVVVGIENDLTALLTAVNDVGAYRVLRKNATENELRAAVLGALRIERERRVHAKLDRTWVRGLLGKIEAALPGATLARIEETGAELPLDLILRDASSIQYRGGDVL
jgi:DNA-binding NtrC family response regulator